MSYGRRVLAVGLTTGVMSLATSAATSATTYAFGNDISPSPCHVPDVRGKPVSVAIQALTDATCKAGKITRGKRPSASSRRKRRYSLVVASQSPDAGATLAPGAAVDLKLRYKPGEPRKRRMRR
jgi:hypothetical protein